MENSDAVKSTTVIGSINPLTKVVIIACLAVVGLMSNAWYVLGFFIFSVVVVAINRKLGSFIKLLAIGVLPMGLLIFVLDIVAWPSGQEYWQWAFLTVTEGGLAIAIHYTARFLMIALAVMVVIFTGDLRLFCRDLEQRGLSSRATYIIQSTGLILPQIVNRGSVIMDAQRSRGIETDANFFVRMKALLPSAAPLILSTLTGVAERASSLEARGMTLTGPRTSLINVPNTVLDKLILALSLVSLAAFIVWKLI